MRDCRPCAQARTDILAAGYGQHSFGPPAAGAIALWSLKNPGAPLWRAATPAGVASLDWAAEAGGLLAVGLADGTVAVYDARARQARLPSACSASGACTGT